MNKGFIALTITLSVAGTLVALVAASSASSFIYFDIVSKKEYRFMNYFNAGNCINQATLRLAQDYFYIVSEPVSIPYLNCSILSLTAEGDTRTVRVRGDFQKAYVYRSAIINMKIHDLEVVKIE